MKLIKTISSEGVLTAELLYEVESGVGLKGLMTPQIIVSYLQGAFFLIRSTELKGIE